MATDIGGLPDPRVVVGAVAHLLKYQTEGVSTRRMGDVVCAMGAWRRLTPADADGSTGLGRAPLGAA